MFWSYRNQSVDLGYESVDWFLHGGDIGLRRISVMSHAYNNSIFRHYEVGNLNNTYSIQSHIWQNIKIITALNTDRHTEFYKGLSFGSLQCSLPRALCDRSAKDQCRKRIFDFSSLLFKNALDLRINLMRFDIPLIWSS